MSDNMICARCRVALNYDATDDKWVHPLAQLVYVSGVAGHEPEPIPLDSAVETRLRCDFCFTPDPQWTEPCVSFDYQDAGMDAGMIEVGSMEDWAACDGCHELISVKDYFGLIARIDDTSIVLRRMPRDERRKALKGMAGIVRQFFDNRTGEGYRG